MFQPQILDKSKLVLNNQFASYKTRQVQTCLKIKYILDKSNNPVNFCFSLYLLLFLFYPIFFLSFFSLFEHVLTCSKPYDAI